MARRNAAVDAAARRGITARRNAAVDAAARRGIITLDTNMQGTVTRGTMAEVGMKKRFIIIRLPMLKSGPKFSMIRREMHGKSQSR